MKRTLLTFILFSIFALAGLEFAHAANNKMSIVAVNYSQASHDDDALSASFGFPQGDDEALNAVKFYPSPVKDMLTVHFDKRGNHTVIIYNMLFERVLSKTVEDDTDLKFDMSQMQNGVYFLNYEFDGKTVSKKFIKQN